MTALWTPTAGQQPAPATREQQLEQALQQAAALNAALEQRVKELQDALLGDPGKGFGNYL